MENYKIQNNISSSVKKVSFILIGILLFLVVIAFVIFLKIPFQEELISIGEGDVTYSSNPSDITSDVRKSSIFEQSLKVGKSEDKLKRAGFDGLAEDDPLFREDIIFRYNKNVDEYPKKIEFGAGLDTNVKSDSMSGVTGLAVSDEQSGDIEEQAFSFFNRYSNILDINVNELRVKTKAGSRNFETISFEQAYKGIPVYLSRTSIAKSGNKWILFASTYLHNINLDVNPGIDENEAIINAERYAGLDQEPIEKSELFVYPSFNEEGAEAKLVYKIDFPTARFRNSIQEDKFREDLFEDELNGNREQYLGERFSGRGINENNGLDSFSQLSVFVDAYTGEIVDVIDNIRSIDFSGRSFGMVFPDHYQQEKIEVGMGDQYISNNGNDVMTDLDGRYLFADFGGGDVGARFTGPYIKVVDYGNNGEEYVFSIDSNQISDFNFLELDESYKQEATNMFYHSNVIHDFFTNREYPYNVDGLNFQMLAEINDDPNCNAWANGEKIHFFKAVDGSCETLSLSSDVIYHEYTHNMVKILAPSLSSVYWGHTGNMNEAYADYFACSLNDDPCLSNNFLYGYGRECLRNCKNTQRFPEDYHPEPHTASMTISGSIWDIREQVGRDIADTLAMLALEYDPQTFQELADNFIIVDDAFYGDGDLSNGAPHGEIICNSFYINHGVYSDYCFEILPLIGVLDLPEKIEEGTYSDIIGSAGGTEFESYTLYYGVGKNPSEWIEITSNNVPVKNGVLYEGFDSSLLDYGINYFKLVVRNNLNEEGEYLKVVVLLINEEIIQITSDGNHQLFPSIYGDKIVWEDYRNRNRDIYMYDLSTNEERQITSDGNHQRDPSIYGDKIVWEDYRNGNYDIYMYDLSTNEERQITSDENYQWNPSIYEDRIVWEDYRNGNWDIYMYDLSTNEERQITSDENRQRDPSIYEDRIVWEDNRNGNRDVYMYDLSTNKERQITSDENRQMEPSIYGDKIVWADNRNGNLDIYMYDLSTNEERQITSDGNHQWNPSIYEDRIVWMDGRNRNSDIYMYDLSTNEERQITSDGKDQGYPSIYGDKIVWEDYRNGNADIYMYEIPKEKPQSKLVNDEDNNLIGNLEIKIQEKNGDSWTDVQTVVNQQIALPANGLLKLDTGKDNLGNQVFAGFNNLDVKVSQSGNYRVYASFSKGGQSIEGNWKFGVV